MIRVASKHRVAATVPLSSGHRIVDKTAVSLIKHHTKNANMHVYANNMATGTSTTPRLHKADLHMLAVFMTVTECGGFAAAQVVLNVGQSTISRQISDLELRLGMRLCQRGRAGFRLTDKGRIVYEACQHLATALEGFRTTVGALRGELVGDLSIAAIDNWASEPGFPLADALRTFRGPAGKVHISLSSLAPDEIERAVLENRVNLGIGVFHQHRPGLVYEALYDDFVELYCGAGHALFDRAPEGVEHSDVQTADLAHRAYLSERQVAPLTGNLPSTAAARQIEGVAFLILSGWHIGYLPVSYAEQWVKSGRMRSILPATYRLKTKIELVTRRGVALTLVSQTFVEILREITRSLRS